MIGFQESVYERTLHRKDGVTDEGSSKALMLKSYQDSSASRRLPEVDSILPSELLSTNTVPASNRRLIPGVCSLEIMFTTTFVPSPQVV